jgi:hypothetical protein
MWFLKYPAMWVWICVAAGAAMVSAQESPIAYVPTTGVTVSGSLEIENGRLSIGNNGTIMAADHAVDVKLARGGELKVCGTTKVQLSRDTSVKAADAGLMIALDRGALEASYKPGQYSDVLLTPDLRILISGPGAADLKIRVNEKGDTCVDNHGANAPYVTVTSQFEGGLYRVQANQRVMFEGGSLTKVVDNERESCGCPATTLPPVVVADAPTSGTKSTAVIAEEKANPFPLAESEGLAKPAAGPTEPVVPVGMAHAEVQAPIGYDAGATPNPAVKDAAGKAPECHTTPGPGCPDLAISNPTASLSTSHSSSNAQIEAVPEKRMSLKRHRGFFHAIGHYLARFFGG